MQNDPLATALSNLMNHERTSHKTCVVSPTNKVIKSIFKLLNTHNYIGTYEKVSDLRGGLLRVNLIGTINAIGAIKPRFSVKAGEYEKMEKRFLPAKEVGILIVTTNQGIMTHQDAKQHNLGGKLLAYCY